MCKWADELLCYDCAAKRNHDGAKGEKIKAMKQTVNMQSLGTCPCGGKIAFSLDPPAVAHEPPICENFFLMDPDEFLTYIRKSLGL